MSFDPNILSLYPQDPGVYLMKDRSGKVLYIGKAKNLRARLRQYYSKSPDTRQQISFLLAQVETIETLITLTEKDALLLENTLIKKHQPKYNILLKDDKSYISLMVTQHRWPMVRQIRYKGKPKDKGIYFGPYPNGFAARQTFDLIAQLFPLRECSDTELLNRTRPCLLYEMGRCLAPCMNLCTQEEYQKQVQEAVRFLKKPQPEIIESLTERMHQASEALDFEKAQRLLQTLERLKQMGEAQHVYDPHAKDCDAIGLYQDGENFFIVVLFFREGALVGSEPFSFHAIASKPEEMLSSFLLQHYRYQTAPPSEILLPLSLTDRSFLEEILSESAGKKISLLSPRRGKKQELIEMGKRNAASLWTREKSLQSLQEKQLFELQETLQLNRYPQRMECFDTSHLGGSDPVASVVGFLDGKKDRSRTRLFTIRNHSDGDDYGAMRQALLRHLTRQKESQDFCDLLILDGGKGHLNTALSVLKELEIATIDVVAVTKESARHDKGLTQEKLYLPTQKDPLLIPPRSPLLFLLQRIRDETHRQTIAFQQKRRQARTLASTLDDLPGIGPVKKKRLLTRFKSIQGIEKASPEELRSVLGIQQKDLQALIRWQKKRIDHE